MLWTMLCQHLKQLGTCAWLIRWPCTFEIMLFLLRTLITVTQPLLDSKQDTLCGGTLTFGVVTRFFDILTNAVLPSSTNVLTLPPASYSNTPIAFTLPGSATGDDDVSDNDAAISAASEIQSLLSITALAVAVIAFWSYFLEVDW